ncbi:hypothetical protein EGJ27_02940 [Pseudomonas sp. v388]|nr:hypothetical protein EGJ27_02940 [Pseudomonas sp. v388]
MDGASYADASTLIALEARTLKPHCAVHSWIVLDLIDDDHSKPTPSSQGNQSDDALTDAVTANVLEPLLPLVLFAHYVEFHSTGRYEKGHSIRTGFAVEYDGRGIFETQDTIYVLLGKGIRRNAPFEVVRLVPHGRVLDDYLTPRRAESRGGIAALADVQDRVYCDLQMSPEQGRELVALVEGLRASGMHPGLESVFMDIEREIGH